ncbi:MAG: GvpL/GvpF family gas vesicle protein [Acidobacteriia bacterium]|nr:GvpL/GvpF family gas vesicle protein [Terriglobia bacterium]
MQESEVVLYLFCFARPEQARQMAGVVVDEHNPVRIFRHSAEVCAVIGEVAREEFCGPVAERQMQQLSWVGPRALRHEAVIEAVMEHSPVLPVRFGTLFSSLPALTEFMDAHQEAISRFLQRVTGHREWSVKCRLDRKRAQQALASERQTGEGEQLSGLSEGARYLTQRRLHQYAERELGSWLEQTLRRVAHNLAQHATDFRECVPLPAERSDEGVEEALHWVFLLPQCTLSPFLKDVDRANLAHAGQGLQFEASGPWPPFRFVPPLAPVVAP